MAFTHTASALRTFGGLFVSKLAQGLNENNSDASGKLNESIAFNIKSKANRLEFDLTMLDYYEFVDEGRKPGRMPPTKPIMDWLRYPSVQDKLGVSGLEDSQIQGLAFQIARGIGANGTEGTDFYTNVINSRLITQDLPRLIEESVGQDIDEAMGTLLDDIN